MRQILAEQGIRRAGVRHNSITASFCVLGTDAKRATGRIDVVGVQTAEFLPSQRRIISKRKHGAIANRLPACGHLNGLPVVFVRNPGKSAVSAHHASSIVADYGVPRTDFLLHQVTVEESEHSDSLLDSRIGYDGSARLHHGEIPADISARDGGNFQLLIGEEAKEKFKAAAIGFERVATEAPLRLKCQPRPTKRITGGKRKEIPTNRLNFEIDCQWISRCDDVNVHSILSFAQQKAGKREVNNLAHDADS